MGLFESLDKTLGYVVLPALISATYRLKNYRQAQNDIGSVHAAAMALLAESSTGFIVGINLPGDRLPLIKRMDLNYVKRTTDGTGIKLIECEMIWMWVTKRLR
jgi:acyl-coenzyme A thioesterase PaaI-like protein